jgi:chemotaxis protein MotB
VARKKKQAEGPKGSPAYMSTWGDLCTLLLCFFVMLLAMSTIDPTKFKVAASSFQNALSGVLESFPSVLITKDILIPRLGGDAQNKRMAVDAATKVKEKIKEEGLEDAIKVQVTETGIAIQIADPIGFESGSADVNPKLYGVLRDISNVINAAPTSLIRVEGHTDNVPIHTAKYSSNWELSSARALNVVQYMANKGDVDPKRMSAIGYGEYRPIAPNDSPENRKTNRRIELYVDYVQKKDGEMPSGSDQRYKIPDAE